MTLSGPSAAARLNINRETFFSNLIFWSLYFRIFYFQEFVSSGVCLVRSLSCQEFVFQEFVMAPNEIFCLWNILSVKYSVNKIHCLWNNCQWNTLSMKYSVNEILCLWNTLSLKYSVNEILCLWNILSMKCSVF